MSARTAAGQKMEQASMQEKAAVIDGEFFYVQCLHRRAGATRFKGEGRSWLATLLKVASCQPGTGTY